MTVEVGDFYLDLVPAVSRMRRDGKQVVYCHGCFDLLHIGHLRHLRAARDLGDALVVTVTPDRWVRKGPDRPVFSEEMRAEAVASLRCVDAVAVNLWPTAVEAILALVPSTYVKGREYYGRMTEALMAEEKAILQVGGRLEFTESVEYHTTDILKRITSG